MSVKCILVCVSFLTKSLWNEWRDPLPYGSVYIELIVTSPNRKATIAIILIEGM